jgi:hypothetical protein
MVYLSVCLSVCLSLSVRPSVHSFRPSIRPSVHPSTRPSIRPPVHPSIHLCLYVWLSVFLSMALQPFVGPCPFFQFLYLFTQSVGLFGRGDQPVASRYLHIGHHKHRINPHRHPGLEWDSNPRSQCSSGRRQSMR